MDEHKICGLTIAEIRRGWQEESRRVIRHFEGQADIVSALLDEVERLRTPPSTAGWRTILTALADAADDVGVKFFDTDTMDPVVERMQSATLAARAILVCCAPSQEGADAALGEPKASEHLSSERRRGLEQAAKIADARKAKWANTPTRGKRDAIMVEALEMEAIIIAKAIRAFSPEEPTDG